MTKPKDYSKVEPVNFSYLEEYVQQSSSVIGILTDSAESHKRVLSDTQSDMISWGGVYDKIADRYTFPSGSHVYFIYEYKDSLASFLRFHRFTHLRFDPYSKFNGDVFHMARISERG